MDTDQLIVNQVVLSDTRRRKVEKTIRGTAKLTDEQTKMIREALAQGKKVNITISFED